MLLTRLTTRFVILLLIVAAAWISKDALLRRAIVSSAESVVGARVEIGHLRTDLNEHRLYLQQVAVADPRDPMTNLFQAELVTLDLEPEAVLARRLVAEHGTATQVRFGAPRTRSGAIGDTNLMTDPSPLESTFTHDETNRLFERWQAQFNRRAVPDVESLTREMDGIVSAWNSTWPDWLDQQNKLVEDLRSQIVHFHDELAKKGTNPLRNHVSAETLQSRHRELNVLLQQAGEKIAHFRREAQRERQRLIDAAARDQQAVRKSLAGTRVDPELISDAVLGSAVQVQLDQMVQWFDDFRSAIPDPETTFQLSPQHGVDHLPAGVTPAASFLIRHLEIDGEGRFANQHFNFSGHLENLTTEPKRLDHPVRFELHAQGNALIRLSGAIDRRGDVPVDELTVDCPRIQLDARQWGIDKLITASTTPARLTGQVELHVHGGSVEGKIHLAYEELMVQLDYLNIPGSLADILAEVNLNLASLNRFQIDATVSGPIDDPSFEIETDLGQKLAATINSVIAKHNQRELAAYKEMIAERQQEYLEYLEREVVAPLELIATALASEQARLVQMADRIPAPTQDGVIRR